MVYRGAVLVVYADTVSMHVFYFNYRVDDILVFQRHYCKINLRTVMYCTVVCMGRVRATTPYFYRSSMIQVEWVPPTSRFLRERLCFATSTSTTELTVINHQKDRHKL
jgi:hypothetical protein